MNIIWKQIGDVSVLTLSEDTELDTSSSEDLLRHVLEGIQSGRRRLVLDFSHIRYVDSSGFGGLLRVYRRLKEVDGELKIFGLQPSISDLFRLTKFIHIFDIFETQDEAIQSFGNTSNG